MTTKALKAVPRKPKIIVGADGAHSDGDWTGTISAEALENDVFIVFGGFDEVGKGPIWHVHPYDEIIIIREGNAQLTVGDIVVEAKAGDTILAPGNVPHKYHNIGPGRLRTIDIHLNATWVQTELADPSAARLGLG